MPFHRSEEHNPVQMFPGVTRRLISAGERTMAVRIDLAPGSRVPRHSHPHEQVGYVASGRMRLTIGEESRLLGTGEGYSIPSGVEHSVDEVPESCVAIDIFSPVREEYL